MMTDDDNNQHLTVDSAKHYLKPRKSVIGKLERTSFQAQRLSDVGVAFSQQITAKVGLKLPASQERIVEQTRWLYLRYVFVKLRQNKLPLRDLNLTKSSRARRAAALGLANGAKIVVSISEPPSASIPNDVDFGGSGADDDDYNQNHLPPNFVAQLHPRSRPLRSTQIDSQDLQLLAARMSLSLAGRQQPQQRQQQPAIGSEFTSKLNGFPASREANPIRASGDSFSSNGRRAFKDTTNEPASTVSNTNLIAKAAAAAAATATTRKFLMDPTINNQIFTVIMNTITELRELKPEFYSDTIYEVIGIDKFSSLDSLLEVQKTICQEMTRIDISWDRIIALFSLFGAMSLDCVRLGAPEHVGPILDGFIGFVERDLAFWISQQGGWESFLYKCRAGFRFGPAYKAMIVIVPLIMWSIFFAFSN